MRGRTSRIVLLLAGLLLASASPAQDAAALRARETTLREQLENNQFRRPLVLESTGENGVLKGDVYAVIARPFDLVGPALSSPDGWCDILMLPANVKNCTARGGGTGSLVSVAIARKFEQTLADAYQVEFSYRVTAASSDYLAVRLNADAGPLGTRDYRIVFEAVPLGAQKTFVHLSYSYDYGVAGRIAMQGYLATAGRNKVGFTVVERGPDGAPVYVRGERGVIERNTMRYYLALEATLGALGLPAAEQQEKRLNDWFTAIDRYPRQLREMDREEYLSMKRRELARRQASAAGA